MSTIGPGAALTLDALVADTSLEEVWVNGPDRVFVAEGGSCYWRAIVFGRSSVVAPLD
jgi:Flp pilus assembly CpaF family ATPase